MYSKLMICHSKTSKRDLIGIQVFMKQMLPAVETSNDVHEARDASNSPAWLSSSYTGRAAFACNLYSSVFADAAKLPAASGRKKTTTRRLYFPTWGHLIFHKRRPIFDLTESNC